MSNRISKNFARVTLACMFALGTCVVHASDAPPSIQVDYSDLKLDTPRGLEALRNRVARAAQDVCSSQQVTGSRTNRRFQKCVRTATNDAFAQVKWPQQP